MPNLNPFPVFQASLVTDGAQVLLNTTFEQQIVGNVTPVQATNPTSATNLMTATLNAGTLTQVGQGLEIFGAGIVNLTTSTSTVTIAVILGGVTIATFTTGAFAISLNLGWNFTIVATVASFSPAVGLLALDGRGTPGGSVTVETHGTLQGALTTAAGAVTAYNDTNTAASSSIVNSTSTLLQVQGTLGTGNAASFITQRQLLVELLN